MTHTEDSIIIKGDQDIIYSIAQDIEKYPEFIPGYIESKIIGYRNNNPIIERATKIKGKINRWKSVASFQKNISIEFEQIEGRLKGMKAKWIFKKVPEGTMVIITHDFKLAPPIFGWFLEKIIAQPAVNKVASTVLKALKEKVEINTQ